MMMTLSAANTPSLPQRLQGLIAPPQLWLAALVLGLVVLGWWLWQSLQGPNLQFTAVVQAAEVKQASRIGGRVAHIAVQEGSLVQAGQTLLTFENGEWGSKLHEAQATLEETQAQKGLLLSHASPADLKQASAGVSQAQQRLQRLLKGEPPESVMQAQAAEQEAHYKYNALQKEAEQAHSTYTSGIISKQKLEEVQLTAQAARSVWQSAVARLRLLKKGTPSEEIAIAKAELEAAKAQYARLGEGAKTAQIAVAEAQIKRASSQVEGLKAKLGESVLKASMNGVVSLLAVNVGQVVGPDTPVISLLDNHHLWVDVFVPESKLRYMQPRAKVAVSSPVYGNALFCGTVGFVSPRSEFVPSASGGSSTNPNTQEATFKVRVDLGDALQQGQQEALRLAPGMSVQANFLPAASQRCLSAPLH